MGLGYGGRHECRLDIGGSNGHKRGSNGRPHHLLPQPLLKHLRLSQFLALLYIPIKIRYQTLHMKKKDKRPPEFW